MYVQRSHTGRNGPVAVSAPTAPANGKCQPKVVTIVEDTLRGRLDLATNDHFAAVHVATVSDAIEAAQDRSVRALLISPKLCKGQHVSMLTRLVARCPGVAAVAVVAERRHESPEKLLDLGACGIRQVIDLATSEGWAQLRTLVSHAGGEAGARILQVVDHALVDACEETKLFFSLLVRYAPTLATVSLLADELGVRPTTIASRFSRIGVPSLRRYLAQMRLLYVVALLEVPRVSLSSVVLRLMYSSPQAFGRHVYGLFGITAGELRREYPFARFAQIYVRDLIAPYRHAFESFDPIGSAVRVGEVARLNGGCS